jgi:hypothetical protein
LQFSRNEALKTMVKEGLFANKQKEAKYFTRVTGKML